ncbi:transglutaminase domain-containing protein [Fodinicola acaciae]|uniref:transglutaminase domain-containing protein n=1 Tax=Fodinicola acaciae TaxID=2681555 RepID=UPI0013D8170D|nr:transglutaminase domain-containing protein [Fodinicola acaciae]
MKARVVAALVVAAAGVAGLFFAPVFGLLPLFLPIVAVAVACYAAVELCTRVAFLTAWRPLVVLVFGLLGVTESVLWPTTLFGLPTGETVRSLVVGVTQSWQLTLQSTWPARPDPELLLFVPLAVLGAAVLGLELTRWAPAALLPSLVIVGFSQAYQPLTGWLAAGGAVGYAVVAAGVLLMSRENLRSVRQPRAWAPAAILAVVGTVAVTMLDPVTPAVSLRQNQVSALPAVVSSPLDDLAAALRRPDVPVFSYTSDGKVDRWRLVVLEGFDGASWTPSSDFRRMGSTVSLPPTVTVPTVKRKASVWLPGWDAPFIPSQSLPTAMTGPAPWLDQDAGVLLVPGQARDVHYGLTWQEPVVDAAALSGSGVDSHADSGFAGVGTIPAGISELASTAVHGIRPSFQAALVLERYLRDNYKVATGASLPTGAGWPQLTTFLLKSKRGTSEQFAAAYVVLARILGIPARIAVGYRGEVAAPGLPVTVHNRDILAWPEVAVAGVGWVPLDPTLSAAGSGTAARTDTGLAAAADQARQNLPPATELHDPPMPDDPAAAPPTLPDFRWLVPVSLVLLVLVVLVLIGIPVAKGMRRTRRRRVTGSAGVVAAWAEARDLLRSHGMSVTSGMTARDVAAVCDRNGPPVGEPLRVLAVLLDSALWSGETLQGGAVEAAWDAVHLMRRGLSQQPLRSRLLAAFRPVGWWPLAATSFRRLRSRRTLPA